MLTVERREEKEGVCMPGGSVPVVDAPRGWSWVRVRVRMEQAASMST
jgi:hypothetical protein